MAQIGPLKICQVDNCDAKAYATGRCKEHYETFYERKLETALERARQRIAADPSSLGPHFMQMPNGTVTKCYDLNCGCRK